MLGRFLFTTVPGSILLGSIIISISILVSVRTLRVKNTSEVKTDNAVVKTQPVVDNPQPKGETQPVPKEDTPIKVDITDDPILGDKNALLTLVVFSDYECPFCKKAFDEILPGLKDSYIKTGKLRLIYKDLPLPFHQNAAKEAEAALCARDQKGDEAFFKYHDILFTKTTTGGTGISLDQLPDFARQMNLNVSRFQECLDGGKFKKEVESDLDEAQRVGASGTPTWFLGKTQAENYLEGVRIIGAQPFPTFKQLIDKELSDI